MNDPLFESPEKIRQRLMLEAIAMILRHLEDSTADPAAASPQTRS